MSYLKNAKKAGEVPKPPVLTIVGAQGTGKTTLAGLFPSPIFMQFERCETVFESWDESIRPYAMSVIPAAHKDHKDISPFDIALAQVRELLTEDHEFKTLVLDTVTAASVKLEAEIAIRDGVQTVADAAGGFHKGYNLLSKKHADLIYACECLRHRKNMTIIYLAHSGIRKIKLNPEAASEYSVNDIEMHPDSSALYKSNSDCVLYVKKNAFVSGAQTNNKGQTTKFGRAVETGERTIITSSDNMMGYVSAKTRYPMPVEIPLPHDGENPLLQYIPFYTQGAK